MNLAPKARFLEQKDLARQFLDMTASEAFCRATELAMVALIQEVPANGTMEFIRGADRFLEILRNLPEEARPVAPRRTHTLNHDLK